MESPTSRPRMKGEAQALSKASLVWLGFRVSLVSKQNQHSVRVENVPGSSGARLHWLHENNAQKVIFYIHGGGFALPANDGHVKFVLLCREQMLKKSSGVAVAFLEYGLTPETRYPTQYQQAVEALNSILEAGFNAKNIVIAGDSAGGNITLALLALTTNSLPRVPHLELSEPIAGIIAICPWTSMSSTSDSYTECASTDIIFADQMHWWGDNWVSASDYNNFTEMTKTNTEFWHGVLTQRVLVVTGENEVFRDDIKRLGSTLSAAGVNCKTVCCPKQVHIDCVLDAQYALPPGPMSLIIWDWIKQL
ncbi:alpha/beta-hydrolase [Pyrenochaeta sp. DS3sAY3a]|nr:alpha/beta-hydrolase [Pyrenochaeta sp. DS3sAY3a]